MNVKRARKVDQINMYMYYRMPKQQGHEDLVSTIDEIISGNEPEKNVSKQGGKAKAKIKRVGQFPEESSGTSSATSSPSSSSSETPSEESDSPKPSTSKGRRKTRTKKSEKKAKKPISWRRRGKRSN